MTDPSNVHGLVRWHRQKELYHAHCLAFGRWEIGFAVFETWVDRRS